METGRRKKERFVLLNDQNEEAGEMTHGLMSSRNYDHWSYICRSNGRGQGLAEKLVAAGVEKARKDKIKNHPIMPIRKKRVWRKTRICRCFKKISISRPSQMTSIVLK